MVTLQQIIRAAALFIALSPLTAYAADNAPGSIDRACAKVAAVRPPASDRPTPAQRSTLAGCDSEALYYGIGQKAAPEKARLCAFIEQEKETDTQPEGFSGSHILMMIYANGKGAQRNTPYAIHLACTSSWAPAERDSRVQHLLGKKESWYKSDFEFCDDATSGLTGGYCTAHDLRFKKVKQDAALNNFKNHLSEKDQAAFATLQKAQAAWAQARSDKEIDLSGTSRASFGLDEENLQNQDFIDMLERVQNGKPPALGPTQFAQANAKMQDALTKLAAKKDTLQDGTVTVQSIQQAQTVWIAYRDAWADFVKTAYPSWTQTSIKTWLTMKRADMLMHLLPN